MKAKILIWISAGMLLTYCAPSKKVAGSKDAEPSAETMLATAQKRWPDATMAQLDEGKQIFNGQCTKCHGAKKMSSGDEAKWEKDINRMAPKARISDDQKEKLKRYVFTTLALQNK